VDVSLGEFEREHGSCRLMVTRRTASGSARDGAAAPSLRPDHPDEEPAVAEDDDQREEQQEDLEPEQENPGGQARPDRDDREYHDGV
jgi:hypothetical protein